MITLLHCYKRYLFLVLCILFFASSVEATKGSKRKTETLTLENGLDVLLISDPDVHRSSAAISVGVGYLYDPIDKPGLAHYLEHMLFLGTIKYPQVDSYKKFLNEHAGLSNAYTSGSITNYYFQVSHDGFEGALDRFSNFFKAPLFDKTYSEREVKAVNNEHEKNKLSDVWRGGFIQKLMSEPGHPLTKFGTGNLKTLAGDNSEDLLKIYNKYYVASNMKLAIISNMRLKGLAKVAKKYFSDIPNRLIQKPVIPSDFRKPLKDKFRLLKIKTIKDIRSLEIDFPTIRLIDYKESKPASIVGSIIGYEGSGSLLSKLKDEGLVLSLSAGGGSDHPNINSFKISISLTSKGLKEYKRILQLVFSYIQYVRKVGVQEYTFKENQTMAQINFDWKSPDEGMSFVANKAAKMQDYGLDEIETLPFLFTKHEPDAYNALMDTLTPENAMVTLSHNAAESDQVTAYYGAEYSFQEVGGISFDELKNPKNVNDMFYPERNDFIPSDLNLVNEDPHLVWDDDLAKVWFKFDHSFKQPKVYLSFRIETPLIYKSAKNYELSKLYEAAVKEGLNEIVYPIQMAGLSYSLSVVEKGVHLTIGGYSERIDDLLKLVTKNLQEIKIDEQKFNNIKEAMIRGLKNQKLAKAYFRGGYYNRLMWFKKYYTEEEELDALMPLTLSDLHDYTRKLYQKTYITGVAHGNWAEKKVKESVDMLLKELKSLPFPENERFERVIEVLEPGERYRFTHEIEDNNNSLAYAIQVGEKDLELQAKSAIVASIVENDFYTQMRTNQQLGYIVWSFQYAIEKRIFFRLVIQSSTHGVFEMSKRVNAWLLDTSKLFESLRDDEFERHKQGLIVSLEKEPDSIGEALVNLFALATDEEGDFQYKKKLVQAVKDLKKEDIIKTAKQLFLNSQTPRIEVLMRAKGNEEKVPEGVITEISQFKNREKVISAN